MDVIERHSVIFGNDKRLDKSFTLKIWDTIITDVVTILYPTLAFQRKPPGGLLI